MELSLMACGYLHLTLPMIPGSGRKKGLCLKGLKERYRTDNPEPRTLDRNQSWHKQWWSLKEFPEAVSVEAEERERRQ